MKNAAFLASFSSHFENPSACVYFYHWFHSNADSEYYAAEIYSITAEVSGLCARAQLDNVRARLMMKSV